MITSAVGALVAAYMVYTLLTKDEDAPKPKQQRSAPAAHNVFSTKAVDQPSSSNKKSKQRGKNDKTVRTQCYSMLLYAPSTGALIKHFLLDSI
jgi:hypothetical protein